MTTKIKYPMVTCCECGQEDEACYTNPTKDRMVKERLCFTCLFWHEKIENWGPDHVCVKGHVFVLRNADPREGGRRGHGGAIFRARRFGQDEVVDYNDVWHNGDVPAHFRGVIVDTAEFVEPERCPVCNGFMTYTPHLPEKYTCMGAHTFAKPSNSAPFEGYLPKNGR